jgi:hypothetical protein
VGVGAHVCVWVRVRVWVWVWVRVRVRVRVASCVRTARSAVSADRLRAICASRRHQIFHFMAATRSVVPRAPSSVEVSRRSGRVGAVAVFFLTCPTLDANSYTDDYSPRGGQGRHG